MHAISMPMSSDNLRSYGFAERVGVDSAVTGQRKSLVQPIRTAWPDYEYTTARPELLEVAKSESVAIAIRDVRIGQHLILRPHEPLVLRASLCVPDDCYRADVPGLEMPISAYSVWELVDAFRDLIAVFWKEYALEDDAKLTARGKRLKARLLRDYREVG